MNIDNNGLEIDSTVQILNKLEESLKSKFGNGFFIKPEGIIDNIALSCGVLNILIQEQIARLAAEFDPESAKGTWQDALYERIGVSRLEAL